MIIDDEAASDVETLVNDGFRDIRKRFPQMLSDEAWPPKHQQKLIAKAASGFFMYAQCIIQFIGDQDPVSRLRDCLRFLDNPLWPRENNPFSALYFIYQQVLSDAELDSLPNTMQILGFCAYSMGHEQPSAFMLAQSLNMHVETLYARLDGLYPVFASAPFDAPAASLQFFHSSFVDFLKYRVNPAKLSLTDRFHDSDQSDNASDDLTLLILSPAIIRGSEIDSAARHPLPKCHRGTRKLMRERISAWLGDMNREESVLWVTGSAGAGKTTVVQNVAEYCQDTGRLGVAVFLSPIAEGYADAWRLVPTLSHQLARQYPGYKSLVNEYLMEDPHILEKDVRSQFHNVITKPLEALQKEQLLYSAANPLVIVLDGLDQYASKGAQTEFISLIAEFTQRFSASTGLLWIISSRPEPHLMKMLQKMTTVGVAKHEEVAITGVEAQDEVEQMLRDGFYDIRRRWSYRFGPVELWPDDIHWLNLRDKASGFFLFASCILRYVADEDQQDPRAMLALALRLVEDAIMPHSLHPFRPLDSLYEQVLVNAQLQDNPVAIGILSFCVNHVARGMTIQNILDVLYIDRPTFNSALEGLHSVVKIPLFGSNNERVEFYHPSFADYLRDPQRSGLLAHQITGEQDTLPVCIRC
ncbi:hypothetical protein AGABI2DRAFT_144820 [Agaricus bisporus var. bisporus H97]|uniref:hypothetical protein n=1 Tax=Agaricus bisporus var. bisporus (strain H97 / ATCC MYA-4626 / FGSC 10389) TaxID=936046 RepID=UPI00029F5C7D|nr:hypothetical protein AGABI2DRAFT_144820 [Agaricus bisporus var. bisporus H97]EKV45390.1 hypothetical protein AGABI2DRAFT_144820 [Agaricus bisporus var. bisporus H97]